MQYRARQGCVEVDEDVPAIMGECGNGSLVSTWYLPMIGWAVQDYISRFAQSWSDGRGE